MLAIADKRSPENTIKNLQKYCTELFLFGTEGITYNSISCHPDIFIFQYKEKLIIAPNAPTELFDFLNRHNLNYVTGNSKIGNKLLNSTHYNCLETEDFFIHNTKNTDRVILEGLGNKKIIEVNQSYTACSLVHLKNNVFFTSDGGIYKSLQKHNIEIYYFSPDKIRIEDHKNGFFGGACGIYGNTIFFNGNIDKHQHYRIIENICKKLNMEIVNLNSDFLYDGGKLFFFEN